MACRYVIEMLIEIELDDAPALSARAVANHLSGDWDMAPNPSAVAAHFANPEQALQSLAAVHGVHRLGEACGGQIVGAEVLARPVRADERLPWHGPEGNG
jgi:hypothetical protein